MKRPLSKPTMPETIDVGPSDASYSDFEMKWPNLFSHLFDEVYEDASKRATSTLLFFVERGILKACLNDRDTGRVVFISTGSISDALDALEAGLSEENLDWRKRRSA